MRNIGQAQVGLGQVALHLGRRGFGRQGIGELLVVRQAAPQQFVSNGTRAGRGQEFAFAHVGEQPVDRLAGHLKILFGEQERRASLLPRFIGFQTCRDFLRDRIFQLRVLAQ